MNILNVAQESVCLILLVLGLVSRSNHGSYKEGVPPYFTGAFIGMVAVRIFLPCFTKMFFNTFF
jgi:hypothetical protein